MLVCLIVKDLLVIHFLLINEPMQTVALTLQLFTMYTLVHLSGENYFNFLQSIFTVALMFIIIVMFRFF